MRSSTSSPSRRTARKKPLCTTIPSNPTRALVLGATGHIGAHVVHALLASGYTVRAGFRTPRFARVLDGMAVERVAVDVDDAASLDRALDGCGTVFHCAAYYPGWFDRRAPAIARGVEQIARAFDRFEAHGVGRIVYTSSAATFGARRRPPVYHAVKVAMERAVLDRAARGAPVVLTNPSVCFGEYDARPFSGQLLLFFANPWPMYPEHRLNAVYTGDVGIGHVRAAERGRIGARYALSTSALTMTELARLVDAALGRRRWRCPLPNPWKGAGERLDGSIAQRELGMPGTPIDEAVRRALRWFQQQRYL